MMPRVRGLSIAALLLSGCQAPADEPPAPAPPPAVERATGGPSWGVDPADEAILAWLDSQRYRETWELLPGTLPLHPGNEPHGALLTTYGDPVAMEAIERAALSMPAGAAILMEDYLADSTLSSISLMVRLDDSDPISAGWRFTRFGPAGETEAGPMDACRGCHVQEPDFVFGWELGTPLPIDSTGAAPAPGAAP